MKLTPKELQTYYRRFERPPITECRLLTVETPSGGVKQVWCAFNLAIAWCGYGRSVAAARADFMPDETRYRRYDHRRPPGSVRVLSRDELDARRGVASEPA